jgi:DNA mismatch repair ATPase MutS
VRRAEPMMVPLFRDLSRVLEKITRPIAEELYAYGSISGRTLASLRPDVIFYVYAVDLIRKLESAGLRLCRPAIAPADERVCEVEGAYNLQLALHLLGQTPGGALAGLVVTSDLILGPRGRIVILTGPNQGGKTTYLQAVGQAHVFAQAGLFVPGQHARISPIDAIATHFPIEERLELGTGRFGDEARRIRAIFERVTRHSLVLLNETFSTTSAGEGLYLARDIVRVLRRIGLRAVFATHLHDLAAGIEVLNRDTPGDSDVLSMVASYDESDRHLRYQIVAGPPSGRSYAERIAARYGIGLEQLVEMLRAREILRSDTPLDS